MATAIPPDGEWALPYVGDAPPALTSVINEAVRLVRTMAVPKVAAGAIFVPDRPRVVSIFGGRGTGKSTVLHFTAHALRALDECLVLPVTDPEVFAPGDTLGGWVLASLDQLLTPDQRAFVPDNEPAGRSVGQLLEDARRAQAIRGGDYLPGLQARGLGIDDFARDAVKVSTHGVRGGTRLTYLFDSVAAALHAPNLKLIIPVDDADLFPDLLPGIVGDARQLGVSARVVLVFAADRPTLAQSLLIGARSAISPAVGQPALAYQSLHDAQELIGRRLVKHFPRSLRVTLSPVDISERLSFVPLNAGSSRTLLDLLSAFPLRDDTERTMADLFRIRGASGEHLAISRYASCLSDNARDLRQVYEALEVIPDSPDAASVAAGVLLRHGLEGLEWDLPARAHRVITLRYDDGRPLAGFDFSGVTLGFSSLSGPGVYRARESAEPPALLSAHPDRVEDLPMASFVRLNTFDQVIGVVNEGAQTVGDAEDAEVKEISLPGQFLHLACFAWEGVYVADASDDAVPLVTSTGHVASLPLLGHASWYGAAVGSGVGGSRTNWSYWCVPRWEGYLDYFTYAEGWSRLLAPVYEAFTEVPSSPELLEVMLMGHLDLITSVQLFRAVPDWIAHLRPQTLDELVRVWPETRDSHLSRVGDQLLHALACAKGSATQRNHDYETWFKGHLPLAATPLLTTSRMTQWLLRVWNAELTDVERDRCVDILAGRARNHITEPMADGDIALLGLIEGSALEPSRSAVLQKVRGEYRSQREQGRHETLTALRKAQIDPQVVAALEAHGSTQEVLLALMQANMRPDDVARVAEAFPERSIEQPPRSETSTEAIDPGPTAA